MKLSIRRKLLIGFTLLLVLSTLIVSFLFTIIQQYISSQITTILQVEANDGGSDILDFFNQLNNESLGLARTYTQKPQTVPMVARYLLQNNIYIESITYLSPLGHEWAKITPSGAVSPENLSYEVYSDSFKSAVSGTPAISQVYYITKNQEPHIDTFYPIFSKSHEVTGVVKMSINLSSLRNEIVKIHLGKGGVFYIVDNNGLLVAHPNNNFVLARSDLSSRKLIFDTLHNSNPSPADEQYVNENNVLVVAKADKISDYNWVAVFEQPRSEAFSFLTFIRNLFIVTLLASFVFLLLIALYLSENLTRPIRQLQKSAEAVENMQTANIVAIKSGDEIEALAHSFVSMIEKLLSRERMLEKVSSELKDANERLKALDKMKNEFVSVASHELRTPMTSIKSYLWMALQGKGGPLNEKQQYYVERSYNSVDRLVRLVNDMLDISRIESGHIALDFKSLDLIKLTQEVIDEVRPRAAELGVLITIIEPEMLPTVLGDSDKIKQVLFNLLGNSIKFTPKGGSISIKFRAKNGMVQTIVSDTGVGIPPEDIDKLFQKFGLLPGSYITNQTTVAGTGLGLYICRSIINLHHGEIRAFSDGPGKGATFTFSLRMFADEAEQEYRNVVV